MSWIDMLTMTVAAVAAFECVTGRLAAMSRAQHRPQVMLGYLGGAEVCILAASMIWQQMDVRWLDWAVWCVALYLLLTWGDWRHGPPLSACRAQPVRYLPGDLVPSSHDDRGR